MAVRMPLATYRLQFSANFTFRDAISILDYLRDLGISHVYASPILTSRRGSGHGYDLTDPVKIDPELGGDEGFVALRAALKERDMGLLLDIVPNHMAASSENRWWMDVLEFGADSPFASYFDINWRPPRRDLENKLLLPFLDKPFAEALEDGELCIVCEDGKFLLRHGSQPGDPAFAIAPRSYVQILRQGESAARNGTEADPAAAGEWQGIVAAAESIAADHAHGPQATAERRARFEALRNRLRQLLTASPQIAARLESTLRNINGTPGDAKSFATLETILAAQYYRLAFWRNVNDTINYRRVF
jgi:(1->4)-alpha-D-glucan 1-alpha-D-glucosylmutase